MKRAIALGLTTIFLSVTVFGLPSLLSHGSHHEGCPLMGAVTVMCEKTIVDHVSMWQMMLASIVSALTLIVGLLLFVAAYPHGVLLAHERLRIRTRAHISHRPMLFQELYSRGIHNRKEPYAF